MVVKLTGDQLEAASEAVNALTLLQFHILPNSLRLALEDTDEAVTAHISERFAGRGNPRWASLAAGTMALRQAAKGGQSGIKIHGSGLIRRRRGTRSHPASPIGGGISGESSAIGFRKSKLGRSKKGSTARSKATRRLYYFKKDPRIPDPFSRRGFGWTGKAQSAAEAPGKIRGKKKITLTRTFKTKGTAAHQRLVWGHFGTKQTVTPKQRVFLSAAGFPVRTGTVLVRPPRPLYHRPTLVRLATDRFEVRVAAMVRAFREGAPGLFSTTVVRR